MMLRWELKDTKTNETILLVDNVGIIVHYVNLFALHDVVSVYFANDLIDKSLLWGKSY